MDSLKEIMYSRNFQRDAPEQLNRLIRRNQRETSNAEVSAFSPVSPMDRDDRADYHTNQTTTENQKINAA